MLELGSGDIYQSESAGARLQVPPLWIVDGLPKRPDWQDRQAWDSSPGRPGHRL